MSTKQSLILVKTSKNPWNKKKNTKQTTNNNKPPQTNSASPRNDTEQWPHLKHTANSPSKKASEPITSPTKSIEQQTSPNNNNTSSSSPNIKYKSNQDTLCKDITPTDTPTDSNGHYTNTITTSTPNNDKSTPNLTVKVVPSPECVESNQEASNVIKNNPITPKKKSKNRKRKSKKKSKANTNNDNKAMTPVNNDEKECITPIATNDNTPSKSVSTSPKTPKTPPKTPKKEDNKNQQQQTPTNGYVLSPVHRDIPPRNYNNYGYRPRNRGRRRGRGRGGYRNNNNYYDDDEYRYYRNKPHRRHMSNGSGAPRHNKDRYRHHNNYNNHNPQSYDMNNNNLWNQPNMYMPLVPNMIGPYGMAPNMINTENKEGAEGEERKSDTTSSSTVTSTPPLIIPPLYNPYSLNMNMYNPYALNVFGEPALDTLHLMVNQMQEPPEWSGERSLPSGPYFVLKVSCVATGYSADDRSVGHISLCDWNLKTRANIFVKPEQEIVSYIDPLTSLNAELLDKYGYNLDAAINIIRSELPSNAVIIGQNITMDIEWLGLKANTDFKTFIDLRDIWRSWSEYYKSYTHYSLNHQSKCILNVENAHQQKHSASFDAITTMKLFQYYMYCRYYNMQLFNNKINVLQATNIEPSFAKKNPVFEGVQMQSKKYKGVPYITSTPKKMSVNNNINPPKPVETAKVE